MLLKEAAELLTFLLLQSERGLLNGLIAKCGKGCFGCPGALNPLLHVNPCRPF